MPRLYLFLTTLLIALCIALVATPVAAQSVYQWKDAKGVTHYADSPPPGKTYTNRQIRHNGDTSAPQPAEDTAMSAEDTNCKIARSNLKQLDSGVAVGIDRDGDGKPDANLTKEERDTQSRLAKATIDVACAKSATAAK